ncbi:MAG: hypothetical protein NTU49_00930 [Gammaproteobacteria bacterium]|nr:hypothetical protein [Gammaproteobacteria bacterium]
MPLGYFFFWILSDTLCTTLMMVSVALIIYFSDTQKTSSLILAFIFSLASGLTQTYGMIPFVILTSLLFLDYLIHNRQFHWQLLFAGFINALVWIILQKCWESVIPHIDRPMNFGLLHLSLNMASFYFNMWSFAFLPLIPVALFVFARFFRSGIDIKATWLKIGITILFFASLTFFYQWPDSRFTFIYTPLVFAKKLNWSSVVLAVSGIVYGLLGLVVAPASYWGPELSTLTIAPDKTWMAQVWFAAPNDRFQLAKNCTNVYFFCDNAIVPVIDPYANKILTTYKAARLLSQP